jgi:hypothetical protein
MVENKYYRFKNNSAKKKYTWAYKIEAGKKKSYRCQQCGKMVVKYAGPISVSVEGGTEYPDILGCGEFPLVIVTELVISAWESNEIKCFNKNPIKIINVESEKLTKVTPPNYFWIEIEGNCSLDLKKSGYYDVKVCKKCGQPDYFDPFKLIGYEFIPGSYSGEHLFRDEKSFPYINFCTEDVLRIAGKYSFTNFHFERMDSPNDFSSRGIDYKNLYP